MGSLQLCLTVGSVHSIIKMNKFLAVLFLAGVALAAPEAEADPALLYGGYGYGLGGGAYGLGTYGLGLGAGVYGGYGLGAGVYGNGAYRHGAGVYGYGAPAVYGGYASVNPGTSTSIAGLAAPATPAVAGGYAAAGRYVAKSGGVVHVAKREAEAEADAALLYGNYGYGLGASAYGYGLGASSYGYGLGAGVYGYGAPAVYGGYASVSPSASTSIAGLAPAAAPGIVGGYAAAGRYCANSAGVIHCA